MGPRAAWPPGVDDEEPVSDPFDATSTWKFAKFEQERRLAFAESWEGEKPFVPGSLAEALERQAEEEKRKRAELQRQAAMESERLKRVNAEERALMTRDSLLYLHEEELAALFDRLQVPDEITLPLARADICSLQALSFLDHKAFAREHGLIGAAGSSSRGPLERILAHVVSEARRTLSLGVIDSLKLAVDLEWDTSHRMLADAQIQALEREELEANASDVASEPEDENLQDIDDDEHRVKEQQRRQQMRDQRDNERQRRRQERWQKRQRLLRAQMPRGPFRRLLAKTIMRWHDFLATEPRLGDRLAAEFGISGPTWKETAAWALWMLRSQLSSSGSGESPRSRRTKGSIQESLKHAKEHIWRALFPGLSKMTRGEWRLYWVRVEQAFAVFFTNNSRMRWKDAAASDARTAALRMGKGREAQEAAASQAVHHVAAIMVDRDLTPPRSASPRRTAASPTRQSSPPKEASPSRDIVLYAPLDMDISERKRMGLTDYLTKQQLKEEERKRRQRQRMQQAAVGVLALHHRVQEAAKVAAAASSSPPTTQDADGDGFTLVVAGPPPGGEADDAGSRLKARRSSMSREELMPAARMATALDTRSRASSQSRRPAKKATGKEGAATEAALAKLGRATGGAQKAPSDADSDSSSGDIKVRFLEGGQADSLAMMPSWTCADLAEAVCDKLISEGKLRPKPPSLRAEREAKLIEVFTKGELNGARMSEIMNEKSPGREINMIMRRFTKGQTWVDDVQLALSGMVEQMAEEVDRLRRGSQMVAASGADAMTPVSSNVPLKTRRLSLTSAASPTPTALSWAGVQEVVMADKKQRLRPPAARAAAPAQTQTQGTQVAPADTLAPTSDRTKSMAQLRGGTTVVAASIQRPAPPIVPDSQPSSTTTSHRVAPNKVAVSPRRAAAVSPRRAVAAAPSSTAAKTFFKATGVVDNQPGRQKTGAKPRGVQGVVPTAAPPAVVATTAATTPNPSGTTKRAAQAVATSATAPTVVVATAAPTVAKSIALTAVTTRPFAPAQPTVVATKPIAPATKPIAPTTRPIAPAVSATKPVAPATKSIAPDASATKPLASAASKSSPPTQATQLQSTATKRTGGGTKAASTVSRLVVAASMPQRDGGGSSATAHRVSDASAKLAAVRHEPKPTTVEAPTVLATPVAKAPQPLPMRSPPSASRNTAKATTRVVAQATKQTTRSPSAKGSTKPAPHAPPPPPAASGLLDVIDE